LGGQTLVVKGPIDHDVVAAMSEVQLNATIGGSLNYLSRNTLPIDRSKVKGGVTHQAAPQHRERNDVATRLWSLMFWIASGLIMTLVAIWLAPQLVRSVTAQMMTQPGSSAGWGALVLLAGPAVFIALSLTLIGLPLAMLLGVLWTIGIATSGLFAGVAVGQLALGRKETDRKYLATVALAGVPLVLILGWLPYLGFAVTIAAAAWAVGGMVLSLNKARTHA
jgi:hypothetical protein